MNKKIFSHLSLIIMSVMILSACTPSKKATFNTTTGKTTVPTDPNAKYNVALTNVIRDENGFSLIMIGPNIGANCMEGRLDKPNSKCACLISSRVNNELHNIVLAASVVEDGFLKCDGLDKVPLELDTSAKSDLCVGGQSAEGCSKKIAAQIVDVSLEEDSTKSAFVSNEIQIRIPTGSTTSIWNIVPVYHYQCMGAFDRISVDNAQAVNTGTAMKRFYFYLYNFYSSNVGADRIAPAHVTCSYSHLDLSGAVPSIASTWDHNDNKKYINNTSPYQHILFMKEPNLTTVKGDNQGARVLVNNYLDNFYKTADGAKNYYAVDDKVGAANLFFVSETATAFFSIPIMARKKALDIVNAQNDAFNVIGYGAPVSMTNGTFACPTLTTDIAAKFDWRVLVRFRREWSNVVKGNYLSTDELLYLVRPETSVGFINNSDLQKMSLGSNRAPKVYRSDDQGILYDPFTWRIYKPAINEYKLEYSGYRPQGRDPVCVLVTKDKNIKEVE